MLAKKLPGIKAPKLHRTFNNWASDKRGLAAVEFAMIAVPFFILIFGLLEIAAIFVFSTVLEHGLTEASRDIRTGQTQGAGIDEAQFKDTVCDELFDLLDCNGRLFIDVRTFENFGSTSNPSPIDQDGLLDSSGFDFMPGGANDIVVVRAFYEWDLFVPVLSAPLENLAGGKRLLSSTVAFRNEPFGSGS